LRVDTANSEQQRCLVSQVFIFTEVSIHIAIPEIAVATCAASPFPLCFCRKRNVQACLFAQLLAIFHSVIVAYTDNRLIRLVSRITLVYVVFPQLVDETAVVFRINNTKLLVGYFHFTHPERFVDLHLSCRISIRFAVIATHYEFTCRDTNEVDLHTRSDFDLFTVAGFLSKHVFDSCLVERPSFRFHFFHLYRSCFFRHNRSDRTLCFQIRSIVSDFFLPVYPHTVGILICQFFTTFDLIESLVRNDFLTQNVCIEVTFIRSVIVDPVIQFQPFFVCQFHVMVTLLQDTNQFASVRMIFIRLKNNHITFTTLTVYVRMKIQIRSAITQSVFLTTTQVECFAFAIVTSDTSTIQDRLNFQVEGE